jgi:hypothetical protein
MMLARLVLFVLIMATVSGIEVDMDCPEDIYEGEEFECEVEVREGDGRYDLKVEVDKERNSALEIWDEDKEDWISGYYYLKEFIRDDEVVRLRIERSGKYDVILKLREESFIEEFDVGRIKVREVRKLKEEVNVSENDSVEIKEVEKEVEKEVGVIFLGGSDEVLSLSGSVGDGNDEKWDYVSKDGKVSDWLPYVFCLFLIGIIGVLLLDRF